MDTAFRNKVEFIMSEYVMDYEAWAKMACMLEKRVLTLSKYWNPQ